MPRLLTIEHPGDNYHLRNRGKRLRKPGAGAATAPTHPMIRQWTAEWLQMGQTCNTATLTTLLRKCRI